MCNCISQSRASFLSMEEGEEVVVVYEYTAALPDELSLKVGDVITKVERMEGGWWKGDLAGVRGMFPDNFVKQVKKSSPAPELKKTISVEEKYDLGSLKKELNLRCVIMNQM